MSRPPSVLVTRTDPSLKKLIKMFKKQREGDKVRHLHAIILMIKKQNAEIVAELMDMDADTIRRWVESFNEGGLEGLYKKKVPEDDLPSQ
jgi:hypothetical protein